MAAEPSAAQRNMGQDGRFHTEDKASILPVLDLLGVLFTKLCVSLLPSWLLSSYAAIFDP